MKRGALLAVALLATMVLAVAGPARSADAFDVYFVAVGNSRYAEAHGKALIGLGPIPGANKSARTVGELLAEGGATFGVILTGGTQTFVSKSDIDSALDAVTARVAKDQPRRPLLVFYFAGHGVSEGVGWNHYSLPGELVARGDPLKQPLDTLVEATVHAATLVHRLKSAGLPYLVMLDTCYEGQPAVFENPVLSPQTSATLSDISAALRKLNEFEDPEPVLFSAQPGQVVKTAPDPRDPGGERLAPMARRLLLARQPGETLSLAGLIAALAQPRLDSETAPPVTHATPAAWWGQALLGRPRAGAEISRRVGSAAEGRVCCDPSPPTDQQKLAGVIEVTGTPGEFITDGRNWRLMSGFVSVEPRADSLRIHVDSRDGYWIFELYAPDKSPLKVGLYAGAELWSSDNAHKPGLSISGPGRGCSAVAGSFRIEAISWTSPRRLRELAFEAEQRCDDLPAPLKVTARLRAAGS